MMVSMTIPLWQLTGAQLQQRLEDGACTRVDIVAAYDERIARCESAVQAWSWVDVAQAKAQAAAADAAIRQSGQPSGALDGFMVGIKDIIDTGDMPTAYGAALYAGHRPATDASLVARLKQAGAVILGKTVTTEFAFAAPGPTRNPHDVRHTPGGSSSGSAAAVAAGMATAALSSQTGGSTIRPAAFCGVVGFKPTHGVIDSQGMKPLALSSDTVGIHARTVADAAQLFGALTSAPTRHAAVRQPASIAWLPGPHAATVSDASTAMLDRLRQVLQADGIAVSMPDIPPEMVTRLGEENRLIMAAEASRSLAWEYQEHRAVLAPQTVALIERGLAVSADRYAEAIAYIEQSRGAFDHAMRGFDALLTFAAAGAAPLASAGLGDSLFNRPWSALGTPCLALPSGSGQGLPLAVQLVGRCGRDWELLAMGGYIEALIGHVPAWPSLG